MEPIVYERALSCGAAAAFDAYTGRIGDWWHPNYTPNPATLTGVTIEPRVGGRVHFTHSDLGEIPWGEVRAWEPGARIVHTSTLAQDREHPSEITATFTPAGTGCAFHFEHGGWTEHNAADRSRFGDWALILDRFAALAEG